LELLPHTFTFSLGRMASSLVFALTVDIIVYMFVKLEDDCFCVHQEFMVSICNTCWQTWHAVTV